MQQELLNQALIDEAKRNRRADHEIDSIFINRWSPRAFLPEGIEEETLRRVFEAARWAPSSYNEQPWRFIIARTPEDRQRFVDFLMPANQAWAHRAPVLALVLAKRTFSHNGQPNLVSQFDAGCAWGYMALSAWQNGLITHGMGGFDRDKARLALGVPEDYDLMAVIAIGKHGNKSDLPEDAKKREFPSGRRPLPETIMEGKFQAK